MSWRAPLFISLFAAGILAQSDDLLSVGTPLAAPPASAPSVFERVFPPIAPNETERIPFPFSRLREELVRRLNLEPNGLAEVVIPLGRALQRDAAAPDFFASPRHVLAITGEAKARRDAILARDRLYVGYQPRANSLEVISFNETTGRFDFLLVEDYAPGGKAVVRPAPRALCESCHQNGGPIFPRAPWSETDANPQVSKRVFGSRAEIQGLKARPATEGAIAALAISDSVERTNRFGPFQSVWRLACAGPDEPMGIKCRASVFENAIRAALSTATGPLRQAEGTANNGYAATFKATWKQLWPNGLAIADPILLDRDPIATGPQVTAEHDPLSQRESVELWKAERPSDRSRIIRTLASQFSARTLDQLDHHLIKLGRTDAPRQRISYDCSVLTRARFDGVNDRVVFRCTGRNRPEAALEGYFYVRPGQPPTGGITLLELAGGERLSRIELTASRELELADHAGTTLAARHRPSGRAARRSDGTALEEVRIEWRQLARDTEDPSAETPALKPNGQLTVTFIDDSSPLRHAVAQLQNVPEHAKALSGHQPFNRPVLIAALFEHLGLKGPLARNGGAPSEHTTKAPPARKSLPEKAGELIAAFRRHCAVCHDTAQAFPPNFLHGGQPRVREALRACAARIRYRLAMWAKAPDAREKSPMPPPAYLGSIETTPRAWSKSTALAELLRHAESLASGEAGKAPATAAPYRALPACVVRR